MEIEVTVYIRHNPRVGYAGWYRMQGDKRWTRVKKTYHHWGDSDTYKWFVHRAGIIDQLTNMVQARWKEQCINAKPITNEVITLKVKVNA